MNDAAPIALEARKLVKQYPGVLAVNGVSFSVAEGTCFGLLGPNGAGKTTTMKMLTGLINANSGSAYICGIPVATHPEEIKRKINEQGQEEVITTIVFK